MSLGASREAARLDHHPKGLATRAAKRLAWTITRRGWPREPRSGSPGRSPEGACHASREAARLDDHPKGLRGGGISQATDIYIIYI